MGPGLFESVYEEVLFYTLSKNRYEVKRQVAILVYYEDVKMDIGFRADIIVENKIIIELKSVEFIIPVFKKQLLTYIKLAKLPLGLLINFNEELLKNGITRIINTY